MHQVGSSWRPDLISILVGLVLGSGLVYLGLLALPHLRRLRDGSLDRMQETQAWVRGGVERRFQAEIAHAVSRRHMAHAIAPLNQLFVPPRILASPLAAHPDEPPPLATGQLVYLWPALAARVAAPPVSTISLRQLLLNGRRVLLASPGGSGKSTLLAYCAFLCAHATQSGGNSGVAGANAAEDNPYAFLLPVIPIPLHLADLHLGPSTSSEDGAAPLIAALQQRAGSLTAPGISGLLLHKLDLGHVLLLLDGWDEINHDSQAYCTSWLRRLLARYPEIQVIIATASDGFEPLLDCGFTVSGLAPWRAGQARKLGRLWAGQLHLQKPPPLESYWRPDQTVLETTLRLWLQSEGPQMQDRRSPALLAAALTTFAQQAATEDMSPETIEHFWQALAFHALQQGDVTITPALVEEQLHAILAAGGTADAGDNERRRAAALRASLEQGPIFAQATVRKLRFVSGLWRDHLAADHMAAPEKPGHDSLRRQHDESGRAGGWDDHLWRDDLWRDPCWREVILHYASMASVENLANWILEAAAADPYFEDLFQVAGWLAAGDQPGSWRRRALVQLGQMVVKPGIPQVQQLRAIATLAHTGEPGVLAFLRQLLQRSDPALRQAAVAALARVDPVQSVPLLEQMLADGDAGVRVATVYALGWQNHAAAENLLLNALIGRDDHMRQAAVEVLALNGPESWRILQEAASDEDVRVRRASAQGLAHFDESWAGALLREMELNDDQWVVRAAATLSLETRAQRRLRRPWLPAQAADLDWLVQWAAKNDQALSGGAAAVTMLCEILSVASDPAIRATAARSLAQVAIPADERTAVWASLLQAARIDGNGAVREAAYSTLLYLQRARGSRT